MLAVQAVIGSHLFAQQRWFDSYWNAGRQWRKLDLRVAGERQHRAVNLIDAQRGDTFGPFLRLCPTETQTSV